MIVVSALSRGNKASGTTNSLLQIAKEASLGRPCEESIEDIASEYLAMWESSDDGKFRQKLEISKRHLIELTIALSKLQELTPKTLDVIVSFGEAWSMMLVTEVLQCLQVPAEGVDLTVFNGKKLNSKMMDSGYYNGLAEYLGHRLDHCKAPVVVVPGFFALPSSNHSVLGTIGRGYSDLCAALLSSACRADSLTIWKQVAGVFAADPDRVAGSHLLESLTPEEAAELTHCGAEVLHPLTMRIAVEAQIPVYIRHASDPELPGTLITNEGIGTHELALATAVTVKEGVTVLHLTSKATEAKFLATVFALLADFGIPVDLISTSRASLSLALSSQPDEGLLQELSKIASLRSADNLAIISLVGQAMRQRVGISAKLFAVLAQAGINIEMISQGASEINISCVVTASKATLALNEIYHHLLKL